MSAPRPCETYPFHPPALFTSYTKINLHIYTKLFQLFLPCGICFVPWNIEHLSCTHAPFQNHLFRGSSPFWSHFVLYVVGIDTRFSDSERDGAINSTQMDRKMALTHSTCEFYEFTKGNGVSRTLIAPYQPRSYGQADVLFWNVSVIFQGGGSNSIKKSLARVLFSWRTTPNSVTGQTPAYF